MSSPIILKLGVPTSSDLIPMNTGTPDADGIYWWATNAEGLFSIELDTSSLDFTNRPGSVFTRMRIKGRPITIEGYAQCSNSTQHVKARRKIISAHYNNSERNILTIIDVGESEADSKYIEVRGVQSVKIDLAGSYSFKFMIPLYADDPFKYSSTLKTLQVSSSNTTVSLINDGTAPTYPLFIVSSDTSNGAGLRNKSLADDNHPIVKLKSDQNLLSNTSIDFYSRTVKINFTNYYDRIDVAATEWWWLKPGTNQIEHVGTIHGEWQYRDAWF